MTKLILISLILVGCTMPPKPDAIVPPEKIVHIDPRILEQCEPLTGISTGPDVTFEDILTSTVINFEIYKDCSNKQKNSIILLKKFSNITAGEEKK